MQLFVSATTDGTLPFSSPSCSRSGYWVKIQFIFRVTFWYGLPCCAPAPPLRFGDLGSLNHDLHPPEPPSQTNVPLPPLISFVVINAVTILGPSLSGQIKKSLEHSPAYRGVFPKLSSGRLIT